jgi:two-component system response regulator PilR (NtrC family)
MSDILVVDDERSMREFLEIMLTREGAQVRCVASVPEALKQIAERVPDLVITDLKMKGRTGLDLLTRAKQLHPQIEVIVITAFASDETAIEALHKGAYDYITKPFQVDEIKVVIQRALERQRLLQENVRMRVELASKYDFGNLVGKSARMQEVYRLIELSAPSNANVLITGETGTGKELAARAVHLRSGRSEEAFVPVDCASIPENLMESELFGYRRGAFTGAQADHLGLFELADKGTLFLDEIGELPLNLQVKLLRVLQDHVVKRLGDTKTRRIDIRLVAATNRNLEKEVQAGHFREDLFYRLNVIRVELPPLRQRLDDVDELVRHFTERIAKRDGHHAVFVLPQAIDCLAGYHFPGNVRELENLIERAVALSGGRPIGPELFVDYLQADQAKAEMDWRPLPEEGVDLDGLLAATERNWIQKALQTSGGIKKDAARLLGISFRSFRYRLEKLGMDSENA